MDVKKHSECVVLLLISSCLFGISNSFTAWFVFVPVLFLVKKITFKFTWLYGGLYGSLSYLFYVTWLFNYSKLAMAGVCLLYFFYCAILFFALKCALQCGEKTKLFFIAGVFTFYEFLKTQGFLGFSYGINAYTQYKNIFFIQTSDFGGVWFADFVLNASSAAIFCFLERLCERTSALSYVNDGSDGGNSQKNVIFKQWQIFYRCFFDFFKTVPCIMFVALLAFSYIYGICRIYSVDKITLNAEKIVVAAIQHNTDPWKGGLDFYKSDVNNLIALSKEVMQREQDVKILVWPETAVVPPILKHYFDEADTERKQLVTELLEFFNEADCAFLIGNFNPIQGDDYNSVFLFEGKKNTIPPRPTTYSKMHLVPFSEYFPYKKQFPRIYEALLGGDTHLWTPGTERVVFEVSGFTFATPICFEDTFGSDCKQFVKNGARAFLNVSNDAWSKSRRCQKQHLQTAVFRSVENHIPTIRSTASGVTAYIDTAGRVVSIPEFSKGYLIVEVPILR
ncbi:MAG: apolipoprotein N-acyltransferase [Treponema sp.]|nr:apolipoprotein N-acyltransferase [Treponema sp.]